MTCDRMDIKTIKIMSIRSFVKVYFIDREFVHVIFDHKRSRLSQIINNNSSVFCSCSYLQTIYIFHFRNCSNIPIIIFWRLYKSLKNDWITRPWYMRRYLPMQDRARGSQHSTMPFDPPIETR